MEEGRVAPEGRGGMYRVGHAPSLVRAGKEGMPRGAKGSVGGGHPRGAMGGEEGGGMPRGTTGGEEEERAHL